MFLNRHVLKILIAAFWQYATAQYIYFIVRTRFFGAPMIEPAAFWPVFISALIGIVLSLAIFIGLLTIMRAGELRMIRDFLLRRGKGDEDGTIESGE